MEEKSGIFTGDKTIFTKVKRKIDSIIYIPTEFSKFTLKPSSDIKLFDK